ncbi:MULTISPECIES: hypothetical protein [unclassified Streptomyces]|uniref:hypothetical protein n=1 Tax=unclassified Streptomyces TaxID=2593676 RepID=UPI0038064566
MPWAWAFGAGLLAASLPNCRGPLLTWTGGADCGFLLSWVVGGAAYLALTARPRANRRAATDAKSEAALMES